MKPKVLLETGFRRMEATFSPDDLERLHDVADVIWGIDEPLPDEVLEEHRSEIFAFVCAQWRYGDVSDFPSLKAILEVSGRHPSPQILDYDFCRQHGIRVLSCAPAFGPMVAETALGFAIDCARGITREHVNFVNGDERYLWGSNEDTFTLFDRTVGYVGFGGLATHLTLLLAPFRCKIQVYDPWRTDQYLVEQGVMPVTLDMLLQSSEVIFVLAIPSVENEAMLDREKLSLIQPKAVFLLMSRSHVVDFDALTDLLYQGRFRAAIDVFPEEPVPKNHPIRQAPNVILSAHRAGSVPDDLKLIGHMVVNDIEAMAQGLPPFSMQNDIPEITSHLP